MRTKLRSKVTLLFMTCAVLLAVPAVAWAAGDQFQDTLVGAATTQTINAGAASPTPTMSMQEGLMAVT
jgi:hypothetical protein